MSQTSIVVQNLTKIYKLYAKAADRVKEALHPCRKVYHQPFHALHDISFNIAKGETVGIVGKNGSGKSTLLKIISGVLTPTHGTAMVDGKVSALLELGTGFNPELTGIENVYFVGTIMRYSKEEIDSRLDKILAFADIGAFIDQPVKMYSSGMFARLAFAVSINFDPDILVVDEVLAVGDTRFQIKCIDKMKEIRKNGTTILFVSHALEHIRRFCRQGIWLESGKLKAIGDANHIVNVYEDSLHLEESDAPKNKKPVPEESGKIARIRSVEVLPPATTTFADFQFQFDYEIFVDKIENLLIGVAIYDRDRRCIFAPNTYLDNFAIVDCGGRHTVLYYLPRMPLLAGTYFVDAGIFTDRGLVCLDYICDVATFTVSCEYFTEGMVYLNHEWRTVDDEN